MTVNYRFSGSYQNYITWSQTYVSPYWDVTTYPMTIVPNATTAPDGTLTAYSITGTTTGVGGLFIQTISSTGGIGSGIQTSSIYAKANTTTQFTLNSYYAGDTEVNVLFTLTGAGSAGAGGTIVDAGNGWYRCSIQTPATLVSNAQFLYRVWPQARGNLAAVGCYFWGSQVNNGSTVQQYVTTLNATINQDFGTTGVDFDDAFIRKDLFTQGGLWIWGDNTFPTGGQLGDNTIVSKSSPVQTVSGGTNWKQVMTGGNYTYTAIKTDGTLWLWGYNAYGHLGDNTIANKSSPVQTTSGGTNWKQVAAGQGHITAIKTDGTLWNWGGGGDGALGNNVDRTNRSSPIQTVSGGANWKQTAAGQNHTAAVKTDGTLWLWGRNTYGQLGDNSSPSNHRSSPIQTISGGTNWKSVACGRFHTAAIKTDGTLWLWGYNNYGQVGTGNTLVRSSPVQTVAAGINWKQVSCGYLHTAAIKTDGTLWTWGSNNFYGHLGDNTIVHRSSPVQTVAGGTDWKLLACGQYHTAAVKTDGTLWLWGRNGNGELGINDRTHRSSPIQTVTGGTNWKSVAGGFGTTMAIREDFY